MQVVWFDSLDSTNTRLAADKGRLGDCSVYAALQQTAGRGQRGNRWESGAGENLTFSILFRPVSFYLRDQFFISEALSVGIVDYLWSYGIEARIKWPNDIYVGDRKICGILIENSSSGQYLESSVAGIGFNLNQLEFRSDAPNPVSLAKLTGRSYDLRFELERLLDFIKAKYETVNDFYRRNGIDARYLELLYRRGEWHWFEEMTASEVPADRRSGKRIRARILGIDNSALLMLEHEDGTVHRYGFKEIKYIIS